MKFKTQKILYLLVYNIFIVMIFFISCELLVRLFKPEIKPQFTDKSIYEDQRYFDSPGLRPLSKGKSNGAIVKVNEYGCRAYTAKADKTKKNWLLIGDSVTMGIGVEADSTFAGIIQSQLDSIKILNPSVSGFDVKDYQNVVQYFISDFTLQSRKIDRVFIFWCLNDVYTQLSSVEVPGGKIRYLFSDFLVFLKAHSRFYYFLKTVLFDRPKSYFMFDSNFYKADNPTFQDALEKLKEIRMICEMNEIDFTLILFPYEYQYRDDENNNFFPQDLIINSLKPFQGEIIDVRSALNERFIKDYYLYGDGIHFSDTGHKTIARYLIKHIHLEK